MQENAGMPIWYFKFLCGPFFCFLPHFIKKDNLVGLRYGGIWLNTRDAAFGKSARKAFMLYCKEHGIRRFEIRNNPFILTLKVGKLMRREPFVYIPLGRNKKKPEEVIRREHMARIRKAQKLGVIVKESRHPRYIRIFHEFYTILLKKKGVQPHNLAYFLTMSSCLKNKLKFIYAEYKKEVIAVSLIMIMDRDVFMTFGAMNDAGYATFAKYMMIRNLILAYKKQGFRNFVLGTGCEGKDAVYRFKRGFADKDYYIDTYGGEIR